MTVQDLLFAVLPRLQETSGVDILQAANAAVRSIGKRLAWRRSDLVKRVVELDCAAGEPFAVMPSGVLGLAEAPALVGSTKGALTPLATEERSGLEKPGTPRHYELLGRQLYLFPYPATEVSLKALAFALPRSVTGMDDDLPWPGILDELLTEAVYRICSAGPAHVVDPAFEAFITLELDRMLPVRSSRPKRARSHHF